MSDSICTLDLSTTDGLNKMINAHGCAVALSGVEVGTALDIDGIMIEDGTRANGDACHNTYLFAVDGNVYFTQSVGIYRSAKSICDFAADRVSAGVTATLNEVALGNGHTMKQLSFKF